MNNPITVITYSKTSDTINGLYLKADANPGLPQYARLDGLSVGLVAGILIFPDRQVHRLQISHAHRLPSIHEWLYVQRMMPYSIDAQPDAYERPGLFVLEATYQVIYCVCGAPRVLYEGGPLEWCRRCRSLPLRLPLPEWVMPA